MVTCRKCHQTWVPTSKDGQGDGNLGDRLTPLLQGLGPIVLCQSCWILCLEASLGLKEWQLLMLVITNPFNER